MQKCLVLQPDFKYFQTPSAKNNQVIAWKSNRLSEESIKPPSTSNISLVQRMKCFSGAKIRLKLDGGCQKQKKIAFHYRNIVNMYIVYYMDL